MLATVNARLTQKGRNMMFRQFLRSTSQANQPSSTGQPKINDNVPGLSENCVSVPKEPVGPGASKNGEYKNPEYYCYHTLSFHEAEIEMAKYRLPAPSNKQKFVPQ